MRRLSDKERVRILGGCSAIGCTIIDLANRHIGTRINTNNVIPANVCDCKEIENECFIKISKHYPNRTVFGWYNEKENIMRGLIYIQCNQIEASDIALLAKCDGSSCGSLVDKGPAENNGLEGFFKFVTG